MRERIHLQQRSLVSDGMGGPAERTGPFETVFTCAAGYRPLVGSEVVQASRLTGKQPYVVTIRSSAAARVIDTTWQIQDARTDKTMNITAVTDPDGKRQWLEILAVEGGLS